MRGLRLATLAVLAVGCADARKLEPDVRACLTWKQDIQPLYDANCKSCHGEKSYLDVLPDVGNWVAAVQDARHTAVAQFASTLSKWIDDCHLDYEVSAVHAGGIMNPADSDFHGKLAQSVGFNLNVCAQCHGTDFSGGAAGASCLTCHQGGPTACTTCHGQPPQTGAHLAHVNGDGLGRKLDCSECHVKPTVYTDAGHLNPPNGPVSFGALAGANARFDGQSCSVYCHGNAHPTWTADASQAACGTCHGTPPSDHQNDQCQSCHPSIDGTAGKHVDGHVDLGDGSGGCTACHGQPPATGAHVAHVSGEHRLRGPMDCVECHVKPTDVMSAGHIDHPPPAVLTFGTLAGAGATWSESTQTCNNYCHGQAQPMWGDPDAAFCGSCHGIPPQDSAHAANLHLTDCVTCHPQTVDALGAIKVANGQSTHINGVIDVQQ